MRRATVALFVTLLVVGPAWAGKPKPPAAPPSAAAMMAAQKQAAIQGLQQQISAAKQEEKQTVQAVQARVKALLNIDRLGQQELQQERDQLRQQEQAALALTADANQRALIHQQYEVLRGHLTAGVKLEEAQKKQLREQERVMLAQIKELFGAHVKGLEAQIAQVRALR
jgi:hypothetical protein